MPRLNKNEQVIADVDRLLKTNVNLSSLPRWLARIESIDRRYSPERKVFQKVYSLLDSHEDAFNLDEEGARALFREKFYGKRREMNGLVADAKKELRTVRKDIVAFNEVCKNDFLKHGYRR